MRAVYLLIMTSSVSLLTLGHCDSACGCCSNKHTPADSCCTVIVIQFLDVKDPEADVFQKLISSFAQRFISGEIFMTIQSVFLRKVSNRQISTCNYISFWWRYWAILCGIKLYQVDELDMSVQVGFEL